MSKWEKLLEKIRNNPKGVTFEEVDKVLRSMGYVPRQPRGVPVIIHIARKAVCP